MSVSCNVIPLPTHHTDMKRSRTYLLLVVLVILTAVLATARPWEGHRHSDGAVSKTRAESRPGSSAPVPGAALDGAAAPRTATGGAGGLIASPAKPIDLQTRDMVETAALAVRVGDVDAAANTLDAKARSVGGRVDGDDRSSDPRGRTASLVLRVPASKLPTLIDDTAALGEELNRTLTGEDMTAAHADINARIGALQASVDRLTEFLKQSSGIDALVRAENELTQRQTQLDSARAQKRALEDQIDLATLNVSLTAKPVLTALPVERKGPLGFGSALSKGWHSVVLGWRYSVAALGYAAPYVALTAVVAIAVWIWRRRTSRPIVVMPSEIV